MAIVQTFTLSSAYRRTVSMPVEGEVENVVLRVSPKGEMGELSPPRPPTTLPPHLRVNGCAVSMGNCRPRPHTCRAMELRWQGWASKKVSILPSPAYLLAVNPAAIAVARGIIAIVGLQALLDSCLRGRRVSLKQICNGTGSLTLVHEADVSASPPPYPSIISHRSQGRTCHRLGLRRSSSQRYRSESIRPAPRGA